MVRYKMIELVEDVKRYLLYHPRNPLRDKKPQTSHSGIHQRDMRTRYIFHHPRDPSRDNNHELAI